MCLWVTTDLEADEGDRDDVVARHRVARHRVALVFPRDDLLQQEVVAVVAELAGRVGGGRREGDVLPRRPARRRRRRVARRHVANLPRAPADGESQTAQRTPPLDAPMPHHCHSAWCPTQSLPSCPIATPRVHTLTKIKFKHLQLLNSPMHQHNTGTYYVR